MKLVFVERVSNESLLRTKSHIRSFAQISFQHGSPFYQNSLQSTSISSLNSRIQYLRAFSTQDRKLGEHLYQQYFETRAELENLVAEKEKQKSKEMFKAWQRSEERAKNPKTTGVAVVKTLVKQTRKQTKAAREEQESLERQAQELLEQAALELKYPQALVQLGNQTLLKVPDSSNKKESLDRVMDLYRQAGECGAAEGWYNSGNLLWTGYKDVNDENLLPADQDASMEIFHKAIDLGDPDAMYFVGVQRLSVVDADEECTDQHQLEALRAGLELIEQAGGLGHGGALYYLALFYLNGHHSLDIAACSPREFVKRLDKAVDAGNSDALFLRGHSYYHGENGYSHNYRFALEDFLKAADEGHADAAVSAGAMLHQGHPGIHRDQEKAFELYQHAGELGSIEGWRNVVACYATGEGVPQSKEIAKYIAETMLVEED